MADRAHGRTSRTRRFRRGFTLVEVLVALTAGLIVSAAAYTLARNAMKSFQDESRISSGQVGVALGMSRLTADLQRAGYMATPNVDADPRVCDAVTTSAVPLRAIQVLDGGEADDPELEKGGYDLPENVGIPTPDALVISGNMTSAEQFEYRGISAGTMYLAANRGPARRAFEDVGKDRDAFCEIFVPREGEGENPGRFARIVEPSGKETYVVVTDCEADTDGAGDLDSVQLTIEDPATGSPPSSVGSTCGARPGGGLVNPVSVVRYRVTQICDPYACDDEAYGPALASTGPNAVTGEASRLELVREEIAPGDAGTPFDVAALVVSREILTEFAVDLDFAFVVAPAATDINPTTLAYYPSDDDGLAAIPAQRYRSVRVRLATRARVPDRDQGSPDPAVVTRIRLPDVLANNRFARLRTLHSDVTLPNLQQVTW